MTALCNFLLRASNFSSLDAPRALTLQPSKQVERCALRAAGHFLHKQAKFLSMSFPLGVSATSTWN